MRIKIVTPAPRRSVRGNNITASNWRNVIGQLGHEVTIATDGTLANPHADCLIALHARKCGDAIRQYRTLYPNSPIIVCLTGTDLHGDLQKRSFDSADNIEANYEVAFQSLLLADALVLLEPKCIHRIPSQFRSKCHVIVQSSTPLSPQPQPDFAEFLVTVIGHLRPVKDPFRTAIASRQLPADSRIKIIQLGEAITEPMRKYAEKETNENSRYQWIGAVSKQAAMEHLCRSRATVVSSHFEGGCNVISEAVVNDIPILSSKMDASFGLLGEDYKGLFEIENTTDLIRLLNAIERNETFSQELSNQIEKRKILFEPAREKEAWRNLLNSLVP